MTLGEKFILSCVSSGKTEIFITTPEEYFTDAIEKKLLKFVKDYLRTSGVFPTMEVINEKFTYKFTEAGTPEYYQKELYNRFIYVTLGENVPGLLSKLKEDPQKQFDRLIEIVSKVQVTVTSSRDVEYNPSTVKRKEEYDKRTTDPGGITYISTGNALLDDATFGFRETDLWTLAGRGGSKKTWHIISTALDVENVLPEHLNEVMMITNEIGEKEFGERVDCLRFKLNYKRFQKGCLRDDEFLRYERSLKRLSVKKNRMRIICNCTSLEDLTYKMNLYRPAIVFIDGSHLFEPKMEEGPSKTTYITRNLKSMAMTNNIPIFNTTHLRKGKGKRLTDDPSSGQDEFKYTGPIEDSDFAIKSFSTPDMVYHGIVGLDFVKTRRSERTVLNWSLDFDTMSREYTMGEMPEEL